MTLIIRPFIISVVIISSVLSFNLPLSYKYEMSLGYDDNFMRFSDFEIDSYDSQNSYLGDAKTYDSAILSNSIQFKISPKLKKYQTNTIFRLKHNYYSSSSLKSYISFLGRFEFKLAPYSWIKLSYSLLPDYYLRTYIDRDLSSSGIGRLIPLRKKKFKQLAKHQVKTSIKNILISILFSFINCFNLFASSEL